MGGGGRKREREGGREVETPTLQLKAEAESCEEEEEEERSYWVSQHKCVRTHTLPQTHSKSSSPCNFCHVA